MDYFRRVIKIRGQDSPNVQAGIAAMNQGLREPSAVLINTPEQPWGIWNQEQYESLKGQWEENGKPVRNGEDQPFPGVLTIDEYLARRKTWDSIRQCVGLDAEFYEGAEVMLFPPAWLNRACSVAQQLDLQWQGTGKQRKAKAMGVDPGEGGANSSWVIGDDFGVIEVLSIKTPDTTAVPNTTIMLMRKYGLQPEQVAMDRGGGGKQHADWLKERGFPIITVAFGESPSIEPRRSLIMVEEKLDTRAEKYAFVNRRAEMYWTAREVLDPALTPQGYGIPAQYTLLLSELSPIPMQVEGWSCWDQEGRFRLPSKNKRKTDSEELTLTQIIGHSPDEADAFVLMLHILLNKVKVVKAGVY